MFLNELQEKNKELFLKICLHASLSNKVFADEEKEMIYAYCREMNVPESIPDGSELDNVIEILGLQADGVEKKIIILEILGLLKADGNYDEKEKRFIEKLDEGLDVDKAIIESFNGLLERYAAICEEIHSVICA